MIHATVKNLLRTRNVFLAALFVGLFAMAARNVTDPDVWWHLKTGQYIADHRSVPHTDPFSYTRGGQPWVAHEWLSELLLYELERTTGWGGLILIFAAILTAAFFLLYLRCGPATYVAGVATLVAAWATVPLWGVRPQILSLLLTSLWLLILDRSERNPKLLWWTLPLTLLWVNLHAGFAVGLALSALYLAGEWIERTLGRSRQSPSGLRFAALIFLLDVLIVPLNPNGLRMFSYPIETLRSPAMQKYIAEWASPNFHHAEYWPFLLVVLTTFAALSWSRLRAATPRLASVARQFVRRPRLDPPDTAVRTDRGPAGRHAARRLATKRRTVYATRSCQLAQRPDPAGNGGFRRSPCRPGHPAPAAGRDRAFPHPRSCLSAESSTPRSNLQPLRLGWLPHLEALPLHARLHRRPRRSLWTTTVRPVRPNLSVQGRLAATLPALGHRHRNCSPRFRAGNWFANSPGWTVSYEDSQAVVLTALPNAIRREPASAKPSIAKPNP